MNFLGVDPDMHNIAWAIVDHNFRLLRVGTIKSKGDKEQDAVLSMVDQIGYGFLGLSDLPLTGYAVEAQELYIKSGINPRTILHLAHISGALLLRCHALCVPAAGGIRSAYFPRPAEWKGQKEKLPHHKQILYKAGFCEDQMFTAGGKDAYCGLKVGNWDVGNISDWKHITDAIGLAQFAAEQYTYTTTKNELLRKARA